MGANQIIESEEPNLSIDSKIEDKYDDNNSNLSAGDIGDINPKFASELEIYQDGDKFVIRDSIKEYARFDKRWIAKYFIFLLNEHNRDVNYFKNNNIFTAGLRHFVFKLVGENVKFLGTFEHRNEAEKELENFNKQNNGCNVAIVSKDLKYDVEINGEVIATFSLKNVAENFKQILKDNGCDLKAFKNNNIFKLGKLYFIFILIDDEIKFLGQYDSKEVAENFLNEYLRYSD